MLKDHETHTCYSWHDLSHIHSLNAGVLEEGIQLFVHPEGHDLPGSVPGYIQSGRRTGMKG